MPTMPEESALRRAYEGLKRLIRSDELPVRTRIDIQAVARTLRVSTMPVRQALSLLVAERLVRVSQQSGYEVALYTEAELADLYEWRGDLLGLCLPSLTAAQDLIAAAKFAPYPEAVEAVMQLLASGANGELRRASRSADERLFASRTVEAEVLGDVQGEFEGLVGAIANRSRRMKVLLRSYHRRRIEQVKALRARVALRALPSNGARG